MTETTFGLAQSERIREGTGLLSWLGLEIEAVDDGRAVLTLPYADHLVNAGLDFVHGGAIATLVDNAAATAVRTVLSNPETARYATADLNVSYLRPATSDLRAEAEVRRAGASMVFVQVDITAFHDGERKVVAIGRVSFFVVSDE